MQSVNVSEKSWFDICEEEEQKAAVKVVQCEEKETEKKENDDGFISIKKRKRKQKNEDKVEELEKEPKIYICKSLRIGVECQFGDKCNYAHSIKELEPQNCSFGEGCGRIKIVNNIVKNIDSNNPCAYLHGSETIKNYLIRHKMNEQMQLKRNEKVEKPVIESTNEFAYTRLCTSIIDYTKCLKGAKCTYAHNPEQLKINPCTYGVSCFHVSNKDGEYINNSKSEKTCIFLHPHEELSNYATRVFNMKKTAPSGFVTPKAKKIKTDVPPPAPKKEKKAIDRSPKIGPVPEMILEEKQLQTQEDKIIVNVPAHMAIEMLEMILKTGKTNIELRTF